uniref:Uncharacterized protein n=1 Tax=Anguilla anguilla TaxID=7936 RepID=A0A0E9QQQ2_ANGAN
MAVMRLFSRCPAGHSKLAGYRSTTQSVLIRTNSGDLKSEPVP